MRHAQVQQHQEPRRRLSFWRVLLALLILSGIGAAVVLGLQKWNTEQPTVARSPWFASYVDVTATPTFAFEQMGTTATHNAVLSFIVSLPSDPCTPSWGGAYTLTQASGTLDLDRRIARLQQQGGNIAVSFGGLLNDELAVKCTDKAKLKAAYKAVIEQYKIDTIDLDLEQTGLTDSVAGARRATVIAELQAEYRASGKSLAVWVTLPVAPQGMTEDGTNAISWLLANKVDLAGINVMTMDYGQSKESGQTMQAASESALTQVHRQIGILYQQAGIYLNSATLWSKIGATPMIGQNDIAGEIFTLDDAKGFNSFALSHNIGRMSMWSANRDITCGSNYVNLQVVSDSCSGIKQEPQSFSALLGAGFNGSMTHSASIVTQSETTSTKEVIDNPEESPYQIWSESGAYLQGTKVVWHGHVYQAKWWTQGDSPDNPVLQAWQTPWDLIGPVLPGEKPIKQATLPAGTYPDWSGTSAYDAGQRVLFNGVPYQAKWWTQGNSPATAAANPTNSPWAPLTQAQINEIQAKQ